MKKVWFLNNLQLNNIIFQVLKCLFLLAEFFILNVYVNEYCIITSLSNPNKTSVESERS